MKLFAQPQTGAVNLLAGVPKHLGYHAAVAPHTLATRTTLSVVAGKRVCVSGIGLSLSIATVATTDGESEILAVVTKSGGAEFEIGSLIHHSITNSREIALSLPLNFWLVEGDVMRIRTIDAKVGGTMLFNSEIPYTEFDI